MANNKVSYWCQVVFDNFKGSVVRLDYAQHFLGNGFVVFANGNACLILTCAHILPESDGLLVAGSTVSACFHTGVRLNARVAYVDAVRDLALLRTVGISFPRTPLRFYSGPVLTGIDVVLLSFLTMKYGQVLAEPGTFPGKILSEPVLCAVTRTVEIRSDYTSMKGKSGAPVFLQRVNQVVGVNSGAIDGTIKTSISVQTVHATLKEWLQTGDENITIEEMLTRIAEH